MLKVAALAGAIGLVAFPAAAQSAPPAGDPLAQDPDKAASLMAAGTFMFGCLERAPAAASAQAYADGATALAEGLKGRLPPGRDYPFALEGVNGDTCRVSYHGAHADELWRGFAVLFDPSKQPGCEIAPANAAQMLATCPARDNNPAYTLRAERAGDHVSIAFVWRGRPKP